METKQFKTKNWKIYFATVEWEKIGWRHFLMFDRFTYVKGFTLRIFIFHIRILEINATEKLMAIAKQQRCAKQQTENN